MSDLLPFVVIGLVTGSLYGLAAAGLVLTYKTSGIFNFAHGATGAAAAFAFAELRDDVGLPAPLALAASCFVGAPLAGLALSLLAGRLARATVAARVVATVGVLLVVQGAIQLRYGIAPRTFDTSLPSTTFRVAGINVGYDQVLTIVIALVGLGALEALFRRSRLGLEMRAVVDNPELLELTGTSAGVVRGAAWAVGATFAALSGILLAPTVGLDALLLTLVVVQAFGAAAIGRFSSIPLTFLGGLGLGVLASALNSPAIAGLIPGVGSIPGLDQSVPFLALFAVLVLAPRSAFPREVGFTSPAATPDDRSVRADLRWTAVAIATAAIAVAPSVVGTRLPVFTLGAVFVVIFASLHLLVEVSGQVSLCHTAFVAIGATTFAHVTTGAGAPWLLGVLAAAVVAVPVGAFVAIPAIRLSGVFLALATFGFGILVERLLYNRGLMFGGLGSRVGRRPAFAGLDTDRGYFWLCALAALGAVLLVQAIRRGQLGRFLAVLAESPVALSTHGLRTNTTRVLAFCTSAAIAAGGGALYIGVVGSVSSIGTSGAALVSFNSLLWLAVLAFMGRSASLAPLGAALLLVVAPSYASSPDTGQYQTLLFGAIALTAATFSEDIRRAIRRGAERSVPRPRTRTGPVRASNAASTDG